MEDDWIEFYSDRENLENYYDKYDKENHTSGFVKRKFKHWKKYYENLKKDDPKYWKFYFSKNMEPDILAFEELSKSEKKVLGN